MGAIANREYIWIILHLKLFVHRNEAVLQREAGIAQPGMWLRACGAQDETGGDRLLARAQRDRIRPDGRDFGIANDLHARLLKRANR